MVKTLLVKTYKAAFHVLVMKDSQEMVSNATILTSASCMIMFAERTQSVRILSEVSIVLASKVTSLMESLALTVTSVPASHALKMLPVLILMAHSSVSVISTMLEMVWSVSSRNVTNAPRASPTAVSMKSVKINNLALTAFVRKGIKGKANFVSTLMSAMSVLTTVI